MTYKVRTCSSSEEASSVTEEHETDPIALGIGDLTMHVEMDCRRKWVSVKLIIEEFLTRNSDGVLKLVSGRAAKMLVFAMNFLAWFRE